MGGPRTFNFADIWEMAADSVPEREALVVGTQRRSYAELEERANRLAAWLADQGVGVGDHVAIYLENSAEYLETMLAAYKLRAVPINVNYRYVADELRYLLDDSDSVGVITQPSLRPVVDAVVDPALAARTAGAGAPVGGAPSTPSGPVGDATAGTGAIPPASATPVSKVRFVLSSGEEYDEALAASSPERVEVERSGDDHYVLYTGGTTGLPKGVVWRQEDAFFACIGGGDPMRLQGVAERPEQLAERIIPNPFCYLPLAPMIHAAAQWTSLSWLFCGGKVVLMPGSLDPDAVWRTIGVEGVQAMTVVGDAVARPLLDAWDAAGGYDVPTLVAFSSGGAPLSEAAKRRVLATFPHVSLADGFGSSEAGTQGSSRVSANDTSAIGKFTSPAKPTIVVDPDGNEVVPGSGVVGKVLAGGRLPLGYHNDPTRTAETFLTRDGDERWLVTGDMATVEADGSITLMGRASGVINTGGEKVFPEEVEAVLRTHARVYDCLVVGTPDDRWGSAVTAVVHPVDGADLTLDDLAAHCKGHLAGYKAPKRLVLVDRITRSPTGKPDYRWAKQTAIAATTTTAPST
jgi:acyl-CoA synthetase (AMP-forming)/AMP-acid ligase II